MENLPVNDDVLNPPRVAQQREVMSDSDFDIEIPLNPFNKPGVEFSKSNRAGCKICNEKIDKGVVRWKFVKVDARDTDHFHDEIGYMHVECVPTENLTEAQDDTRNHLMNEVKILLESKLSIDIPDHDQEVKPEKTRVKKVKPEKTTVKKARAAPPGLRKKTTKAAAKPMAKAATKSKAKTVVKAEAGKPKAKAKEAPTKVTKAKAKKPVKVKAEAVLVAFDDAPRFKPRDRSKSNAYSRR